MDLTLSLPDDINSIEELLWISAFIYREDIPEELGVGLLHYHLTENVFTSEFYGKVIGDLIRSISRKIDVANGCNREQIEAEILEHVQKQLESYESTEETK